MNHGNDLQMLGLDICADIMVGNEMMRGISGGQKKRVTTGTLRAYIFESLGNISCLTSIPPVN